MKKLLKIFLIFVIVAIYSDVLAQYERDWVDYYSYSENSIDQSYSVTTDIDGFSYVTGHSYGNIATIGYYPSGVRSWVTRWYGVEQFTYANVGYAIVSYRDRNWPNLKYCYVTGKTMTTNNGYDFATIKYLSGNGNLLWDPAARTYNGSGNGEDVGRDIVVDAEGNVYVTGWSIGNGTNYDYATIKYNSQGVLQWDKRYNRKNVDGNDKAISLSVSGGRVHVAGVSQSSTGIYDIVVVTYDSEDGSELWISEPYPGYFQDWSETEKKVIATDYSRGVYVTGIGNGGYCVVLKYDPSDGELLWDESEFYGSGRSICIFSKTIGNSWPHTNDVFVTGSMYDDRVSAWTFGIIKYDDDGDRQWFKGYRYNVSEFGVSICVDNSENVCATGVVYNDSHYGKYGTVIYDENGDNLMDDVYDEENGTAVVHDVNVDVYGNFYITGENPEMGLDYLTIKYSPSNSENFSFQNPNLINNNELEPIPTFYQLGQNYPNPFNPKTKILYQFPYSGYVSLKIFDILGREISELVNEYKAAGYYSVDFDGSKLASGVYIYRLQAGQFIDMKKMILIK